MTDFFRNTSVEESPVFSVSELNNQAKKTLEQLFGQITVEGEISNFTCASSGHWYFSLKDDKAQISCAMFISAHKNIIKQPNNGDKVLVKADLSVYVARGNYQLIVQGLQLAGLGQWQIAYAELHKKLAKEGLFEESTKKTLPMIPQSIGIISSEKGAALHDILRTIHRRYSPVAVRIYPASVQGEQSEQELLAALQLAEDEACCDVLIIARGGGSIEDLWSFNLESIARAVHTSSMVTISAIGHETDYTITDYVADVRASTPTAAAELATPDSEDIRASLQTMIRRLHNAVIANINTAQQGIDQHKALLRHPAQKLAMVQQAIEQTEAKLHWLITTRLEREGNRLNQFRQSLAQLDHRAVLKRGYIIAQDFDGVVIGSAVQAKQHKHFGLQFLDGTIDVSVNGDG